MENINFPTSAALRVDVSWRVRVVNRISDQSMQETHVTTPFHNSIALPTGSVTELGGVPAGYGQAAAGAAKQAAPPRGIPR